jgi:hypothetical protein
MKIDLFGGGASARNVRSKAVSKEGKPLAGAAKNSFIAKCKRDAGAPAGKTVAFSLAHGVEALCTMLAILKCGCSYILIDPNLPQGRQEILLKIAGSALPGLTKGAYTSSSAWTCARIQDNRCPVEVNDRKPI